MTAEAAGRVETMGAFECSCAGEAEAAGGAARAVAEAVALLRRHFRRAAAHAHAADYLRGLIVDVERKNGWPLAERAGYGHPRGIQRVLDRYAWDAEAVRDDLRAYVAADLGDPDGVLVVDETGFPKQGRHSAGVARQYCGVLGKVANCQVGVVLGYAGPRGHAATRPSTAPSSCPRSGWRTRRAAARPRSPRASPTGPSPNSPWRCWSGPWRPGCPRAGSSPTRSTAATASCGGRWRSGGKRTSSPSAATRSPRPGRPTGRRRRSPSPTSRRPCRWGRGGG